jgi:N-acylglucosamine-6-phosphate 2-epimerase
MRSTGTIVAFAQSAELGGAVGVRIDGASDIAAVSRHVSVPIIGIHKVDVDDVTLITPHLTVLPTLVDAGASVVAIELTRRAYPDQRMYAEALSQVKQDWADRGFALMADISTLDEGAAALECGVDLLGTTLAGFTSYSQSQVLPDLDLVARLAKRGARVIAEGGYGRPDEAHEAIKRGAWSVCVGAAITDPIAITREFARALPRAGDNRSPLQQVSPAQAFGAADGAEPSRSTGNQ